MGRPVSDRDQAALAIVTANRYRKAPGRWDLRPWHNRRRSGHADGACGASEGARPWTRPGRNLWPESGGTAERPVAKRHGDLQYLTRTMPAEGKRLVGLCCAGTARLCGDLQALFSTGWAPTALNLPVLVSTVVGASGLWASGSFWRSSPGTLALGIGAISALTR